MSSHEKTICKYKHSVPVKKAKKQAKLWREAFAKLTGKKTKPSDKSILRAFYIPKDDLLAMLDRHNAVGARAYICMRQPKDTIAQDPFHIVVVPVKEVDGHKRDMLEFKDPESDDMVSTVYDFTSPCPSTCDETSQLY